MSGQPTPYLGSKISLISKSEIRYEGILYTVDTKESTIALAKVRSFGTEDRPTTQPIAARDETFEYIIFKATDIKDLMVCETPKPASQMPSGLPYDPAIVSISNSAAPAAPAAPSGSTSRSETPGAPPDSKAPGAGRPHNQPHRPNPNAHPHPPRPARGDFGGGGYGPRPPQGPQSSYRNALMASRGYDAPPMPPQGGGYMGGRGGYGGPMGGYRGGPGGRGRWEQRPQQGGGTGNAGAAQPPKHQLKFDGDYDFDAANAKFEESLEKAKEATAKLKIDGDESAEGAEEAPAVVAVDEEEVPSDPEFYDSKKSFFDNISCEALEKEQGRHKRQSWKRERETNLETFGQSAVRSYNYRRGGPRGYGGRGGMYYRGFRGGNNSGGGGGGGGPPNFNRY